MYWFGGFCFDWIVLFNLRFILLFFFLLEVYKDSFFPTKQVEKGNKNTTTTC